MKRIWILLLLAVISIPIILFAETIHNKPTAYWWTGNPASDTALRWARDIDAAVMGLRGTGKVFYVDSGVTSEGGGDSWGTAKNTLDEAINLCENDRGDVIYIAQGHNEGLSAADAVDCDVSGITIIGCGRGTLRPTFDFDAATDGMFVIGAANVTISNVIFRASTNTILTGVDCTATGDNFSIINCEFNTEDATDEFVVDVNVAPGCNDGLIKGCRFRAGAASNVEAILLDGAVVGITIEDNEITGDRSAGCIKGITTASDYVIIRNNLLFNGTMGGDDEIGTVAAIVLLDDTGGLIAHNTIVSDVATALLMVVADDCVRMQNTISDTDGDEFSGSFEDALHIGADPNGYSIKGHLDG